MSVDSPHVPTRPASDNSNAAASTAYVTAGIAAAIAAIPPPPTIIPAGTAMVFYQASAPSAWTSVSLNDRALRVVNAGGSGGTTGGTNAFSTVFAQTATGNFTLSTNEMPSHTHSQNHLVISLAGTFSISNACGTFGVDVAGTSGATGSGGAHSHAITMSIAYIDVIVCTKN
jgi:pectate lyase